MSLFNAKCLNLFEGLLTSTLTDGKITMNIDARSTRYALEKAGYVRTVRQIEGGEVTEVWKKR